VVAVTATMGMQMTAWAIAHAVDKRSKPGS